ncbi:arginyl-tRNA--protein transferase 1-like protein [Polychytrium aggregatum]|uniref:arginyl-tRNA--protein transferase 1-like protein n=1 Tax=Polychytrium aggregatum TaxID=110093 RepID=UPI0022FEE2A7|nr:arginyl-tRNA--protein transferase 1-like protein [Polychytrium aggregatum]KAI9206191.1 arginyl-tRNA--protein transferase 1-like protein [Polychytrium aggregatum]
MASPTSVTRICGSDTSSCGYCHSGTRSSASCGMWAFSLAPHAYQALIDRGWRRSGQYLYIPDPLMTCCPCYTIRVDVAEFSPSKSQKKTLRKMRRYLNTKPGDKPSAEEAGEDDPASHLTHPDQPDQSSPAAGTKPEVLVAPAQDEPIELYSAELPGPNKKLLKQLKATKMQSQHEHPDAAPRAENAVNTKKLNDLFKEIEAGSTHQLRVELVPAKFEQETFELFAKYQTRVHKDPPSKFDDPSSYISFLVDNPFPKAQGRSLSYGGFHQKYYLDDKLIAVGVIDILPKCVSSVYFMYDPDMSFLSLGVYGAIREVMFAQSLSQVLPDLKYYYMGYYIHSCPQMRYKAQYRPSYLLCHDDYKWYPYEKCAKLLDQNKRVSFSESLKADPEGQTVRPLSEKQASAVKDSDIMDLWVHTGREIVQLRRVYRFYNDDIAKIKELYVLVGEDTLQSIALNI